MSLFRTKTKYDYRTDFLPQGGKFRHLDRIADLNKVVVREPKMDESTVVFLPYPRFDEPDYKPKAAVGPDLIDPTDSRSIGSWLFAAEGVRYFGKNPVSLLFDNPDDGGFIPSEHHPIYMIYEAAIRAVKSKQVVQTPLGSSVTDKWDVLLNGEKGENGSFGCLNQPGPVTLAYALAYALGKEQYFAQNGAPLGGVAGDKPVVFMMTKTTTRTLLEAFDAYLEDDRNPKNLTGALAVHFYDRQKGVCQAKANAANAAAFELGGRRAPAAGGQQQVQLAGYGVHLSSTLSGRPSDPVLPREQFVHHAVKTLKPWEEVLRGHTPEECARVVADQCGLPMSLLYHAWKSRPEFFSDDLKHALKNPVSANFGLAAGAQAGAPQRGADDVPDQRSAAALASPGHSLQTANPFGLGGPAAGGAPPTQAAWTPPGGDAGIGEPPGSAPAATYEYGGDPGYSPEDQARLDEMFRRKIGQQGR